MKLLILTQKVDINDDLLGIYHSWIEKLAQKTEKVNVICLYRGRHCLPSNVSVYSLGKEKGHSRLEYLKNFFYYIWKLKREYDVVFVHMNKEYVILGGLFWRLWGKKIILWYNHSRGDIWSKMAGLLADRIFFTSPFSFFSQEKKGKRMPAGIDTESFKRNEERKIKNSILFVGRISPVKKTDVLVGAAKILDDKNLDFSLDIVGEPGPRDKEYFEDIKKQSEELEKKGKINFLGKQPNRLMPAVYNQHWVSVNLTDSGSLDKTILEAMACETLILVSNKSFGEILPPEMFFREGDADDLAKKLLEILNLAETEARPLGQKLRQHVLTNHDLKILIEEIIVAFEAIDR